MSDAAKPVVLLVTGFQSADPAVIKAAKSMRDVGDFYATRGHTDDEELKCFIDLLNNSGFICPPCDKNGLTHTFCHINDVAKPSAKLVRFIHVSAPKMLLSCNHP